MDIIKVNGLSVSPIIRICTLSNVVVYQYTPTFRFHGESHADWELVYVDIGQVIITAESATYTLNSGQYFLHRPYEFHNIQADNCNCSVAIIAFDIDVGRELLLQLCGIIQNTTNTTHNIIHDILSESAIAFAHTYFFTDNILPPNRFGSLQQICNLLENFFLVSLRSEQSDHQDFAENQTVNNMIKYINQNVAYDITLKDIAKSLGYSQSYLSQLFRRIIKKSFTDYLIDLRISTAKQMMANKNITLNCIAAELGFSSQQYFTKLFRMRTGFTPSQYRKSVLLMGRYNVEKL